jgi:DNA-binding GntR family transcriptional regulator
MKEREAMAYLYLAIQNAHADGMPETQIAKEAGVDRMTVRRALGKL